MREKKRNYRVVLILDRNVYRRFAVHVLDMSSFISHMLIFRHCFIGSLYSLILLLPSVILFIYLVIFIFVYFFYQEKPWWLKNYKKATKFV